MRGMTAAAALLLALPAPLFAHHGVASLGVAGLEGPGAPIETSSSATLPRGSVLGYMKLDYTKFERYTPERDDEGEYNAFWMYGAGYGVRPWLSAYLVAPFTTKKREDNSFVTSGFADLSLLGVVGFKWDEGPRLVPAKESLDDLEDWHFTLYGGLTLPTGDENLRDREGEIDPGMSLGFGAPSYSIGFTSTKQLRGRWTWVFDTSIIAFTEHEYGDGSKVRFGDESRVNMAVTARLCVREDGKLRLDANLEGNFLNLGRDERNGGGEEGTGGSVLYAVPGIRLYLKNASLGWGVKIPAWTDLNEDRIQQGAEGKEEYRGIFTFSVLM